jgi:hypothetical protein
VDPTTLAIALRQVLDEGAARWVLLHAEMKDTSKMETWTIKCEAAEGVVAIRLQRLFARGKVELEALA